MARSCRSDAIGTGPQCNGGRSGIDRRGTDKTGIGRNRIRRLSILLGCAGLLLGTALIGWFGFHDVVNATLSVGVAGFALVCGWQLVLFVVLGLAWAVVLAPDGWRWWVFVWGRMVRDSAANCLPFSQLGGYVLGARAVTLHGIAWPVATASTVVDLTAEFLAQIGLVGVGLLILSARSPGSNLTAPVAAGLAVALVAGIAFIWLQRGAAPSFARFSRRILGKFVQDAETPITELQSELASIYSHTARVVLCIALHLVGWFGTGIASWIAFRLLGADIDLLGALAIEALLHAILATAILVPGYAGVQEAAYAGIGALFGQPPEISLGVSLLRRARDLALGIPVLIIWQSIELRR